MLLFIVLGLYFRFVFGLTFFFSSLISNVRFFIIQMNGERKKVKEKEDNNNNKKKVYLIRRFKRNQLMVDGVILAQLKFICFCYVKPMIAFLYIMLTALLT